MFRNKWPHRNRIGYIAVIIIILVACIVRYIFLQFLGRSLPYLTFYPSVALAAVYGGFYSGLAATFLSIIIAIGWIIGLNQLPNLTVMDLVAQIAFPTISVAISYAIEMMYRNHTQVQEQNRQLIEINQELIQQKRNYQMLVENLPFMIAIFDKNLKIIYIKPASKLTDNQKSSEATGRKQEGSENYPVLSDLLLSRLKTVFNTKKSLEFDSEQLSVNGTTYFHNIIIPKFEIGGELHTALVVTCDLTWEKQMQKELSRLDRLNIIGEMAASIGHELRNPLTTVRGYLQFFEMKEKFFDYREQFTTMIEELDRANFIITEFLSLSKNKTINMEYCNLNDTIKAIFPLLQADALLSGHNIRFELGGIPNLTIDKKEIRQVILNLVRNAVEATPSTGEITIKTEFVNKQVILSVQDTGSGIPNEIIDKLGTPFVTTKDTGTGLGLSVCYRIADRHKAILEFETGPNGTIFFMKFNIFT